jgi:hypothetical protein
LLPPWIGKCYLRCAIFTVSIQNSHETNGKFRSHQLYLCETAGAYFVYSRRECTYENAGQHFEDSLRHRIANRMNKDIHQEERTIQLNESIQRAWKPTVETLMTTQSSE